ncbi:PepSY domain-containing protein [Vannielia litorea]|uniref:PepSY domain-containing protein n=1 Tax=Vannielia TaxID=2813041 RepID=UPI001C944D0E|nr:PepSY domain-containing protein [Vannielia litorea]MBY6047227.1 PepSY domain-containing protein [Vannielia litorea]MBY6074641.1 PepSY domain-containing protein [Vannielia litorea]MBY6152840.1 PepSY domain-containing protein [Vannielia litorea]
MKRTIATLAATLMLGGAAFAESHGDGPDAETVEKIMMKLTEMKCQMAEDDIEMEDDGGYELDDVICEGGQQYDITLDAELNETGRRAE